MGSSELGGLFELDKQRPAWMAIRAENFASRTTDTSPQTAANHDYACESSMARYSPTATDRWIVLLTLLLARFALGFQFQSAGSTTSFLITDFATNYKWAGLFIGLFMLPGVVLAIPSGYLGRRFGEKRLVLCGLGLMLVGGLMATFAGSQEMLLISRVVCGTGATFLFVLMTKMIFDWFDRRTLFFVFSLFVLGWPVGIAAGQAIQPAIAEMHSWRLVFYLSAMLSGAAFIAVTFFYRSPRDVRRPLADGSGRPAAVEPRSRLSGSEIWQVNVAGVIWMCLNAAYVIVISFGPVLLLERGLDVNDANLAVSLVSWSFIIALPAGGYIAYRANVPNSVMLVGLGVSAMTCAALPYFGSSYVMFALLGLSLAFACPVVATLPAQFLKEENRAVGLGIYFAWHFVGAATLPTLAGKLKDVTASAAPCLIFAALLLAVCLLGVGLLRPGEASRASSSWRPT